MQTPYKEHMEVVNRILRNLKTTPNKGLRFKKKTDKRSIATYIDSDWAWSIVDKKKSTFGYCTFVWGNLVA